MEIKTSAGDPKGTPERASALRLVTLIVSVAVISSAATLGLTTQFLWPSLSDNLWKWVTDRGYYALRHDTRIRDAVPALLTRFLPAQISQPVLPELVIDIKFEYMQKLHQKRRAAIARGILSQGSDELVPASIRYQGRTIKTKLRLKGDNTDHLEGNKWSFRVHVKGKDHILGMRRFSIQHPKVRGFQGEILFFETLRHVGVLAPRYRFANITVNGDRVGMMALEEHFSKELLESNRRREGPILRFDESLVWEATDGKYRGFWGVFDDYRNVSIDAFRSSKIAKSPRLTKDYATALGLLRGFVERRLSASETFDSELMGRFLAVARLWGSRHGVGWNNQRFYFNPITAKLEPVGYDSNLQARVGIGEDLHEESVHRILDDPKIFAAYQRTLRELANGINGGELAAKLDQIEQRNLAVLRSEFYLLEPFPQDELRARAKRLGDIADNELRSTSQAGDRYPALVHAYIVKDGGTQYLELVNAVPHDVVIQSASWFTKDDQAGTTFKALSDHRFPLTLKARVPQSWPETVRIPYRLPASSVSRSLRVNANIRGDSRRRIAVAKAYHPSLGRNPIPNSTADDQLARHRFLTLDKKQRVLAVRPGRWRVRAPLIVPPGFTLSIDPGTTLRFAPRGALIAHGPVEFRGTGEAPITLEGNPGKDGSAGLWQGVVVLDAGTRSHWSHVVVRNTTGIEFPGWQLTGGVTFYQSDITIEHARLQGHRGEDAINVVRSKFDFNELEIFDTASDAFDSDFSEGVVQGGLFKGIGKAGGGDAIDVSGSTLTVTGTRFVDIGDKALSVGEQSNMTARGLVIDKAGTGAAAKDGSVLRLDDTAIQHSLHADLMAYVKKPEYGYASIETRNLTFAGSPPRAKAQKGSAITMDGTAVPTEDVDVEQLYSSIMRKGLSR